jgi:hypothetical protein
MGQAQGGEEMIPTLILIVAVCVCFRFIEIGHRERRQGRWLIPILATVSACITVLLTYSTLKAGLHSERTSALHNMSDSALQRELLVCHATGKCSAEELAAIEEEQERRKAK